MHRRRFLTAAGAAGFAGLAGCNNVTTTAIGAVEPPQVPQQALEEGGWTLVDQKQRQVLEKDYGPVTVKAKAHSIIYEDQQLAERVKQDTLGSVSASLALFSATRIAFSPDLTKLPESIGREQFVDQVETNSKAEFESRMADSGLTNIAESETGELAIDTGETARYTGYTAEYEVGTFDVPLPNDDSITVDVGSLAVAGDLAIWVHDGGILVAAGAYPAENYANTLSKDVTDAISVDVSIDLGLTPKQYASEVEALITGTE